MPHMARRPLDEFEGWKISGDFSCDESETEPEISLRYLKRLKATVNNFYLIYIFNPVFRVELNEKFL